MQKGEGGGGGGGGGIFSGAYGTCNNDVTLTYLSLVCLTTCSHRWFTSETFCSMPGGGDMLLIRDMLSSAAASWSSWKDYGEGVSGGGGGGGGV